MHELLASIIMHPEVLALQRLYSSVPLFFPELNEQAGEWELVKVLNKSKLGEDKRVERKTEMKTTNGMCLFEGRF